jgi:uncharacterized protein
MERLRVALPGGGHLALVLHRPAGATRVPCVVACHGLNASKDSDKYLLLAEALPRAGLALARFDFRGCGESSGDERDTTIASRMEDLVLVLQRLDGAPGVDGRFGLLGSSLGGFVALHVAAARGDGTPVVTWNAPADLEGLSADADGETPGPGAALVAEVRSGRHARTPVGIARHLIVQGGADTVVPPRHAVMLSDRAREPSECVVIPDGDHRLTGAAHREAAVRASVTWLSRFLLG